MKELRDKYKDIQARFTEAKSQLDITKQELKKVQKVNIRLFLFFARSNETKTSHSTPMRRGRYEPMSRSSPSSKKTQNPIVFSHQTDSLENLVRL